MDEPDSDQPNSNRENIPEETGDTPQNLSPDSGESSPDVIILDSNDSDSDYANPEPPRELLDGKLINADTIGDTVYSKHWLFTTLMNLIQAVDRHEHGKEETPEGVDLEDSLQDELCKLWDMSMNPAVVSFLMEFKAVDLLAGVINKSKAPRATEICVGILGNMACTLDACKAISNNARLRSVLMHLLGTPDSPTLNEITRLVCTGLSSPSVCDLWLTSLKETEAAYTNVMFILQSSTNSDLLTHTADLIDKAMDTDDSILIQWSSAETVMSVLEAVKQCGTKEKECLDTFLHILQLISTCELGVEALGHHSESLCQLTLQYLIRVCSEDIIVLDEGENSVGSALSVLAIAFTAIDDKSPLLDKDFQLIRCLLKILNVVYPKIRSFTPELHTQRSRSDSCSIGQGQGHRSRTPSDPSKHPVSRTASEDKGEEQNSEVTDSKSESKEEVDHGTDVGGSTEQKKDSDSKAVGDDIGVFEMLYEILQNILTDIVLVLSEDDGDLSDNEKEVPSSEEDQKEAQSENTKSTSSKPLTLTYLNDVCERQRLRIFIYTLDEVMGDTELDCCGRLSQVAQNHNLSRLKGMVEEYSAS